MEILNNGFIELVDHMGNDSTVAQAARVCTLREPKSEDDDRKVIRAMLFGNPPHTSPFEQVEFQFLVKCPIFVARQWMRHRTWSYNEVSRRYTSEKMEFYIPDTIRFRGNSSFSPELFIKDIEDFSARAELLYNEMLDAGVVREQARMILPQNMITTFYAKTDLHNLFHFIALRDHPHAQYEIRVYAQAIKELIRPIVPLSLGAWEERNEKQSL